MWLGFGLLAILAVICVSRSGFHIDRLGRLSAVGKATDAKVAAAISAMESMLPPESAILPQALVEVVERAQAAPLYIRLAIDAGEDRGQNLGTLFECRDTQGRVLCGAGFNGATQTRRVVNNRVLEFFCRREADLSGELLHVTDLGRPADTSVRPELANVHGHLVDFEAGAVHRGDSWEKLPIDGMHEATPNGTSVLNVQIVRNKPLWIAYRDGSATAVYNGQIVARAEGVDHLCSMYYDDGIYFVVRNKETKEPVLECVEWSPYRSAHEGTRRRQRVRLNPDGQGPNEFYAMFPGNDGAVLLCGETSVLHVDRHGVITTLIRSVEGEFYGCVAYDEAIYIGHFMSGFLYEWNGATLTERVDFPPVPQGQWRSPPAKTNYREAQSLCAYGGELYVGMYPWGELWRWAPHRSAWHTQRLFAHPPCTSEMYPYWAAEEARVSSGSLDRVYNVYAQRIHSLIPFHGGLAAGMGKMRPYQYDAVRDAHVPPESVREYGTVKLVRLPYSTMGQIEWTDRKTVFEFIACDRGMVIRQDERTIAHLACDFPIDLLDRIDHVIAGRGAYGPLSTDASLIECAIRRSGQAIRVAFPPADTRPR
jgi:hypothetical protein